MANFVSGIQFLPRGSVAGYDLHITSSRTEYNTVYAAGVMHMQRRIFRSV